MAAGGRPARARGDTRREIRNAQRERMPPRPCRREGGDHLGDVARARRKPACLGRPNRCTSKCPWGFIWQISAVRRGSAQSESMPARNRTFRIVRRAYARASSRRPACSASAPQQPWLAGAITSQPSAASAGRGQKLACRENHALCARPGEEAHGESAENQPGVVGSTEANRDRNVTSRTCAASRRFESAGHGRSSFYVRSPSCWVHEYMVRR